MLHATGGHAGIIFMRLAATRVQFIQYVIGSHSGTIYMQLAGRLMQTLYALAASCMQSRQFFASMLREQLFDLKNDDAIKKSENPHNTCAC
jgi:hypothetical protein